MSDIILVGNPNVGKTTLYNTLTKSNNHVGNWHGVTVEVSCKKISTGGKQIIYDLPGIYSLNSFSKEEHVAIQFLENHKEDVVVNIVDANNLKRNLLLTMQLIEKGYKIVLAVNMANENPNINYKKLSNSLGIRVVPIDARKRKSVDNLVKNWHQNVKIVKNFDHINKLCSNATQDTLVRYNYIDKILSECMVLPDKPYGISKLDKIFLNKYFATPIFLVVMLLVFIITFGAIGNNFSAIINMAFDWLCEIITDGLCKLNISTWAHALITQGVLGGVGVIVGFLPQVTLLFLCMNFLEDVGYLSRVAIMFDGTLKKFGLSGKSVFSILLGFGCTTTAMLSVRALDSLQVKKRTAMVVPFASCSAKLPVFALICSAFFVKRKVLMVFLIYVLGIVVGLLVALIANKISKKTQPTFIMELPPLRLPTLKKTFINLESNVWGFVKRVGGVLLICSVVVWILSNLSFGFKYVTDINQSILYNVANFIYPIFKPLGFSSPLVVVALLVGIVAKEMVVSCLAISNSVVGNLSALATSLTLSTSAVWFNGSSALAFLVFILLYSPCLSAISVCAKEIGRWFATKVFVFQFALAYGCALLTKVLASLFAGGKMLEGIIILLVLALIIFAVLKYKGKNKCKTCKGEVCGKTCLQKR